MKKLVICTGILLSGAMANAEEVVRMDQLNCYVRFQGQQYTLVPETNYENNRRLIIKANHKRPDSKVDSVEASVILQDAKILGGMKPQFVAELTTRDVSGKKFAYATIEIPNTEHKNTRSVLGNGVAGIDCYAK